MIEASVPVWLEYVKAIGPLIVAVIAAAIAGYFAFKQWRTANDKIILDLFDRRFAAYQELLDIYIEFVTDKSDVPSKYIIKRFTVSKQRAQFLFDTDVMVYLDHVNKTMWRIWSAIGESNRIKDTDREKSNQILSDAKPDIGVVEFNQKLTGLIMPYMQLKHRVSNHRRSKAL